MPCRRCVKVVWSLLGFGRGKCHCTCTMAPRLGYGFQPRQPDGCSVKRYFFVSIPGSKNKFYLISFSMYNKIHPYLYKSLNRDICPFIYKAFGYKHMFRRTYCLSHINVNINKLSIQSSPPMLCPDGRTTDLKAILNTMSQAHHYINIAVMDYIPAMLYLPPGHHQYNFRLYNHP